MSPNEIVNFSSKFSYFSNKRSDTFSTHLVGLFTWYTSNYYFIVYSAYFIMYTYIGI